MTVLILCAATFLLGSFPSGIVLGHRVVGRDIRTMGSGNYGAANVARTLGWRAGIVVALLDILKGLVPVLVARWAGLDSPALAVVALAAVLGHDFSIFLSFRGGKGVATTLGVALVLAPLATVLAGMTWLVVLGLSGYSSLASLLALVLLPLLMGFTGQPPAYVMLAFLLFILGAAKHWENIIRLAYGKEKRFWGSRNSE